MLSSHDDGECIFTVNNFESAKNLIKKSCKSNSGETLLNALVDNFDKYILINSDNKIIIYDSFDEYLGRA